MFQVKCALIEGKCENSTMLYLCLLSCVATYRASSCNPHDIMVIIFILSSINFIGNMMWEIKSEK